MIDPRALEPLRLGSAVVRRLLPHRPPLLLVDQIDSMGSVPPALGASKLVSAAEPVFAGHFPDRAIWPGVYTIEGLAQVCALLGSVLAVQRALAQLQPPRELSLVEALDRGPSDDDAAGREFDVTLRSVTALTFAMLAATDVKLTRPILAGQTIAYLVARTHEVGAMHRFAVEARVEGHVVARGTLTMALLESAGS